MLPKTAILVRMVSLLFEMKTGRFLAIAKAMKGNIFQYLVMQVHLIFSHMSVFTERFMENLLF